MPVDTTSSYYDEKEDKWTKISNILEGEDKIKEEGTTYLPQLTGQNNAEYLAYKSRGTFYNAFSRTVNGLTGAVIRRSPVVKVPSNVEPLLENITLSGLSFTDVGRMVIYNIVSYGYFGILVDMPEAVVGGNVPRPYLALYQATDILNWRTVKEGDQSKLTLLVLKEKTSSVNLSDVFVTDSEEQIRVLEITEERKLRVMLFKKYTEGKQEVWVPVEFSNGEIELYPVNKGNNLDYIPFVFFGTISNEPEPPNPPLEDLANLNIKHWQVTVDYFHGLHWCALPTPYFFGIEKKTGEKFTIGPSKAITSSNVNAKCGILEFSGQGLGSVEKALDRLEGQMAVMGARLLEHKKAGVESAEALRLRSSDEVATLATIVGSGENGLTNVLRFVTMWMGGDPNKVSFSMNKDFVSTRLESQDIIALLQSVQAGEISQDTFLWNLKQGEILPEDRSIDDEKGLIQAEGSKEFEGGKPVKKPPEEEELEEEEG